MIPRGMSVQEAYRLYRSGCLLVNRKYQRKLVWTEQEKIDLIDTILKGFPIPLILLAERPQSHGTGKYEILDGVQRLNAIFSFIENFFSVKDAFFDINEFSRAKQASQDGFFEAVGDDSTKLNTKECANILDYQLAVTTFAVFDEEQITEIFGRINSKGRQLSNQERRQAGIVNNFGEFVRKLAADIRGDASKDLLLLSEMPEISIESSRSKQKYGLISDDIFWVKQGILWRSHLRDGEDEEMFADLIVSILLDEPFARSKETLDKLYDPESDLSRKVENTLALYPYDKLYDEIKQVFSVVKSIIEEYDPNPNALRNIVAPRGANAIKSSFYAIFMSFYYLLVKQNKSPVEIKKIMSALKNHQKGMNKNTHYITTENRKKDIDKTTGLIQRYFVYKEPSILKHGHGLAIDFENSLRRSHIETNRYEFKQGLMELVENSILNKELLDRITNTICGIANLGPGSEGFVYIGVADKKKDAERIKVLYGTDYLEISDHFVVGIEREVTKLNITVERYQGSIVNHIRNSKLSEPLKTQLLTQIDLVTYKNYSIVRIRVPSQSQISYVGDDYYVREGSETMKIDGKKLLSIAALFAPENNKQKPR